MCSVGYILLVELDPVVGLSSPAKEALLDNPLHVVGCVMFRGHRLEAIPQLFNCLSPETRQSGVQHQGHQGDDGMVVRSANNTDH